MRAIMAVVLATLLPAVGCTAAVADEIEPSSSLGLATRGQVSVERMVSLSALADATVTRTHVSARFMQLSGGIDQTLAERVVAPPRELPEMGSCTGRTAPTTEPLPPSATQGSIELLDVGEVLLRAGPSTMPLAARAFPDVGEVVSGVVYTSRDGTSELPVGVPYLIETTGSSLIASFSLRVDAPMEPVDLRVGAERLDSEQLVLLRGEALDLEWSTASASASASANDAEADQIIVDVTIPANDSTQPSPAALRCVFRDTGAARVLPEYLSWPELPDEVELTVHRLRRVHVPLPDVEETIVEFDFAVSARVPVADAL